MICDELVQDHGLSEEQAWEAIGDFFQLNWTELIVKLWRLKQRTRKIEDEEQ